MAPKMLQVEQEIDALCQVVMREKCRSVLEIGSKDGGSLLRLAHAMPKYSRVVAVDLPGGEGGSKDSEAKLKAVAEQLIGEGYQVEIIWGDSTDPKVVEKVKAHAPFDVAFIDGNHTLPYLEKDWENYGPLARIVAFHDIAWFRGSTWPGVRMAVPEFWNAVKVRGSKFEEFRFCPTMKNNGIGVLWR